ncbi:hypothetical protein PFISCL1PPCAC_19581, partial [Pristionchus fissidentatus]
LASSSAVRCAEDHSCNLIFDLSFIIERNTEKSDDDVGDGSETPAHFDSPTSTPISTQYEISPSTLELRRLHSLREFCIARSNLGEYYCCFALLLQLRRRGRDCSCCRFLCCSCNWTRSSCRRLSSLHVVQLLVGLQR